MIDQLIRLLDIDSDKRARARELWALLRPQSDSIIDRFYKQIRSMEVYPPLADGAIERLKVKQKQHWERLFHSDFGKDYADSLRRISIRHRDVELGAGWYLVGYMMLKLEFAGVVARSDLAVSDKMVLSDVLDRYLTIDMGLALSSFNAVVLD